MRKKLKTLDDALSFELDEHSRWVLADLLQQFDFDTDRIDKADQRIEAALSPFEALIRLLEDHPRRQPRIRDGDPSRTGPGHVRLPLGPALRHVGRAVPGEQRERRQAP